MTSKPAPIHCVIIVDRIGGAGQSGDEEIANIKKRVRRAVKPRPVVFETPPAMLATIDADMIVFDYGGMAMGYSTPFYTFCRTLVQWVDDHPSSLVVIGSTFTYDVGIEPELMERGWFKHDQTRPKVTGTHFRPPSSNHNVVVGYMAFPYYSDEHLSAVETDIHDWFVPPKKEKRPVSKPTGRKLKRKAIPIRG